MKRHFFILTFLSICFLTINAQTRVPRKILVEDFVSAKVGWCTDSRVYKDSILRANSNVIWASWHSANFNDAMAIPEELSIAQALNVTGYPNGSFDRQSSIGRNFWYSALQNRQLLDSPVEIQMNKTSGTPSLTVSVTVIIRDTLLSNFRPWLSFLVIEDSVVGSGTGYDQLNNYNSIPGHPFATAGNPIFGYAHTNVVREVYPANQPLGDSSIIPINPSIGSSYTQNYFITLGPSWDTSKLSYIAMVNYNQNGVYEVLNAEELDNNVMVTNVSDLRQEDQLSINVFPIPSSDKITVDVKGSQQQYFQIEIMDVKGQLMKRLESMQANTSIDVSTFPKGIYFLRIFNDKTSIVKKVMIE